jgi:hypothetical protein
MAATLVHFFNLLLSKPACQPLGEGEPPETSIDPAKVTCPKCLRYLRKEEATGERPICPWGSKTAH